MTALTTLDSSLRRSLAGAAALSATAGGLLALAGSIAWAAGRWHWLSFGADRVPMAPSTSLLMFLLCLATLLRARFESRRAARVVALLCTLATLAGGALLLLQRGFGLALPLEDWLAPTPEMLGAIPVGRMSPLTAAGFVLAALAGLCAQPMAPRWQLLRSLGGCLALAVLTVASIIAASYAVDAPLLYGGATIPMALVTALAFVFLGGALLLGSGPDPWPLGMFLRTQAAGPRLEWSLLALFLGLTAGIGLVGFRYLNRAQAQAREDTHEELRAIAALKIQQLVAWRNERLGDARVIFEAPMISSRVQEWFANPGRGAARQELLDWLTALRASYHYDRAALLDAQLSPRLSVPSQAEAPAPPVCPMVRDSMHQASISLSDLHRADEHDVAHLDLVVPLVQRGGPAPSKASVVGAVVLRIDPQSFLFPLIQTWPMASASGETLLVRRDGDSVLFLNELRHLKDTVLKLRRSVNEAALPAAKGVRGDLGVKEGVDYRGVPVVAVTRPVPDTPWVMVAKVDQAELYAPLRRQARIVGAVALALLLAAWLGVTVLWRNRNQQFLQVQLVAQREGRVQAERFQHLMKHASDAILVADAQNRVLEANDRAQALYGYSLAELQRLSLSQLRAREDRDDREPRAAGLDDANNATFETWHRRKDGSTFPVEVSSRLVEIGGWRYQFGIVRDITQRKLHEAEIERLNRLYVTLSQVNQTIVRCQARDELFANICRVVVEFGRFRAAWICWPNAAGQPPTEVARHVSKVDGAPVMPGWRTGCDVVMEAIHTGKACLCPDATTDPRAACCREALTRLGVQSCAAFPLRVRGEVQGAFSICSVDPGFCSGEEVRLLEEVTADISFALDKLDKEAQQREAEAKLRFTEFAMEHISDEVFWVSEAGRIEYVNTAACQALGYAREELLGLTVSEVTADFPPEAWPAHWQKLKQAAWLFLEGNHRAKDGRVFPVEIRANYLESAGRAFNCSLVRDISERKRVERERALLAHTIAASVNEVYLFDADSWRFRFVSEGAQKNLGYPLDQLQRMTPLDLKPEFDRAAFERIVGPLVLHETPLQHFETMHRRADGSLYPAEVRLQLFEREGDRVFLAVIMDISERRRAERERQLMEAQLRQQQKLESIGTLASGVAHEINNPITGIMNYAQLIQDRLPPGSPLADFTGEIMHETQRVATIVRNLLTFARNEKQSHSPARVADIVEGTLSLIRTVIRRDQITLTVSIPENLPALKCRSQQIQQVLMNLMTNARDALNARYPTHHPDKAMKLEVRPFEKEGRRWIRMTVEDRGTGITPEVRARMFDPFFTTKPRDQGTGLGLAISHGIVKEHNGGLTVESELGKFTCVHLDLPVDNGWRL